jgi:hypothetical protein
MMHSPEQMPCPNCEGVASRWCQTCEGDGTVPKWLQDPNVVGEEAARSWGWKG